MPPRRKNNQKNDLDRIAKLAAKLGMNLDNLLEQVPLTEIGEDAKLRKEIEAESVLYYIETKGAGFEQKICANPNCQGLFLHTYSAVKYCSDECRAWALAQHGIIWNFHRRSLSERWNVKGKGYVPKIVGVEAAAALFVAGILEVDEEEYVPEIPYDPDFDLKKAYGESEEDEGNETE